ncbi:hypothetical protein [Roseomonas chloroacetimidivorans]|uniref:hypothetical protein n=1 Tax=Roseomonas chloroacetimidivorans TaxID=1766656 RepID=UPI003C755CC0
MILRFGATTVQIFEWGCTTTLPCGRVIHAAPQPGADYAETARRLGYGPDVLGMCHDHDAAHAALAHLLGLPVSPVLSTVAGISVHGPVEHGLEEDAVMAIQRFARTVGVDLRKAWSRGI